MKIILREAVTNLGEPGEVVEVARGYARNYLLPKGIAVLATPGNMQQVEHQLVKLQARAAEKRAAAKAVAAQLSRLKLKYERRVADEDTLYGSVSVVDISMDLIANGYEVARGDVHLEHPIKKLGEYDIPIALTYGVMGSVKVVVLPEGGQPAAAQTEAKADTTVIEGDSGDEAVVDGEAALDEAEVDEIEDAAAGEGSSAEAGEDETS